MPLIKYKNISFAPWKLDIINKAIQIVDDYQEQGYDLSLRQVYYQFVSRDWFPDRWADPVTGSKNNQGAYNKLGTLLADARMAGILDWKSMVDRTREMGGNSHWSNPASIIDAVSKQYQIDKWQGQKHRPEIWIEKDALVGVVSVAARKLDVPYFSCRGYTSLTSIWENAQRLKLIAQQGIIPVIIHLGDHDPSGIDMSRDIQERVSTFMDGFGRTLIFQRVALNMPQVEQYNPPENPAKSTDSRFKDYISKFGESSWELDALEPTVLDGIIDKAVRKYRDEKMFRNRAVVEEDERKLLKATSNRWQEVVDLMETTE